ncbi:MAG: adenine deaminase [Bacteroidales bacterium]
MEISGKIIDLQERRMYPGTITIKKGKIEKIVKAENVPDVYIMPGLVDAHVHIESSMLTPSHFAVAVVKHGTIAVVSDPHEIANVLGISGVKFMLENADTVPVKMMFGAPSCVPATNAESSGARIDSVDIAELLKDGRIGYLAEMMNFPGVIYDDVEVHRKLSLAMEMGVPIDGHAPGLSGEDLKKYIQAGITTDHECSDIEEALEKISCGMKILIREGSAAKNLDALDKLISLYPDRVMLCTDDLHPETLAKGHINKIVSRLVRKGYDMFDVLRAASVNAVDHYGIKMGLLKAGDPADLIVVDNPESMNVLQTWIDGTCVFDGEKALFSPGTVAKINKFNCSRIRAEDLRVKREGDLMRVIVAINGELATFTEILTAGTDPVVYPRLDDDILKIVVKERYHDGPPAVAFIKGFGLKEGAMATSVAHDSHNIIAVGVTDREIAEAINMIVDAEGGMSVVSDEETGILKLPVAGIMSDMPVTAMAQKYERLTEMVKSLGCRLDAPYMTLSFMALLVIPELKLSDKGLFDGLAFRHVPLFV